MKDDLLKIIRHYGLYEQLKYIHSEYFELDEAIIVYENASEWTPSMVYNWKKHITEELADVMVMLKQLQYNYGIEDEEIESVMRWKIERQLERIKE